MALIEGFAGISYIDGKLQVYNHLPKRWSKLSFKIRYRNRLLKFVYRKDQIQVHLIEGNPIHLLVDKKDIYVKH